jgi:hypothetical protein
MCKTIEVDLRLLSKLGLQPGSNIVMKCARGLRVAAEWPGLFDGLVSTCNAENVCPFSFS